LIKYFINYAQITTQGNFYMQKALQNENI